MKDILIKRSQNNETCETEKNVMEESTSCSFTFNIKDKITFTFSKSNQICEGKNCENGFVDFKKEDKFALFISFTFCQNNSNKE